jgi:hypothetical protein
MSEMLKAAWGSGGSQKPGTALGDLFQAGQVRSFRVSSIDAQSGKNELAPA